jgi:hypothetical protein
MAGMARTVMLMLVLMLLIRAPAPPVRPSR